MTVSVPCALLQGGVGFVLRQRFVPFGPEGPDMVVIVLDLDAHVHESGLEGIPRTVAYALMDHRGRTIVSRGASRDAEASAVAIADVVWSLRLAPAAGWDGAVAAELRLTRVASALIWPILAFLASLVAGR